MNDERRERFAAALAALDDRGQWPTGYPGLNASYREYADAAMAVADAEQQLLRTRLDQIDAVVCGGGYDSDIVSAVLNIIRGENDG